MVEILRGLEESDALRLFVEARSSKCFLCRWILEDLLKNKNLTGYPKDSMGKGMFPVDGKLVHIILELRETPPRDPENLEDLASVVDRLLEIAEI